MAITAKRGQDLADSSAPTEAQKRKGQKAKVIQVYPDSPEQRDEIIAALRSTVDKETGKPYWSLSKYVRDLILAAVKRAMKQKAA